MVAGIIDIAVKKRVKTACGTVKDSLFTSMLSAGMQAPLIVDFTDVFSWNVDFNTETRNGDTYCAVWEEDYTAAANMVVSQRIMAAKYKGAEAGANYAFYFGGDFYDEDGKISKRMFLKSPISFKGVRITSRFTFARFHPILRIWRPHLGIDYAAPSGTPVGAVADGVVKYVGPKGEFGNYVEIAHSNNYVTCYGHLKSFNVRLGEHVRQGKVIAYVGRTGLATGPHLDFRVRQDGKYLNFLAMKNRNSAVESVPADKLAEFKAQRDKYLTALDQKSGEGPAAQTPVKVPAQAAPAKVAAKPAPARAKAPTHRKVPVKTAPAPEVTETPAETAPAVTTAEVPEEAAPTVPAAEAPAETPPAEEPAE